MRAADFFAFARERHATYLRRQSGAPEPWTEDPIIAKYRFTNVFRELDRTTVWFRENVRDELPDVDGNNRMAQVLGTILFRTLNRIESGEVIFNQGDRVGWQYVANHGEYGTIGDVEQVLREAIPRGPWVTGAYIVKTPDGLDKLRGALWIVEQARRRLPATLAALGPSPSLQGLWTALQGYPFIGGFTGYEIVTDLRHLPILQDAPDILTWANAGPGAKRGLNRLHGRHLDFHQSQARFNAEMVELLALAKSPEFWPVQIMDETTMMVNAPGWERSHTWGHVELAGPWPRWEMREVEHTLCEFDKYERVRLGEGKPRGRFR